ncbi:MAG: hypothetical protein HRT47_06375 [Candidatus Caenarcaniphilales bacterium]|nr:hypothetical protein [Candidatus Caenarcaniphilales bacterium]
MSSTVSANNSLPEIGKGYFNTIKSLTNIAEKLSPSQNSKSGSISTPKISFEKLQQLSAVDNGTTIQLEIEKLFSRLSETTLQNLDKIINSLSEKIETPRDLKKIISLIDKSVNLDIKPIIPETENQFDANNAKFKIEVIPEGKDTSAQEITIEGSFYLKKNDGKESLGTFTPSTVSINNGQKIALNPRKNSEPFFMLKGDTTRDILNNNKLQKALKESLVNTVNIIMPTQESPYSLESAATYDFGNI